MKAPTVEAYSGEVSPEAIKGTWDEGVATSLTVAIDGAGVAAVLGKDSALTSDGKGHWNLKLSAAIPPGIYDVVVKTVDGTGKTASDASAAELYVIAPPPPYDCGKAFAAVQPIHFGFNRWNLDAEHLPIIAEAASVLTDPRCLDRTITIEGHADYIGGRLYNEALSIQRSMTVVAALAGKGVEPRRMRVLGLGEKSPDVSDHTGEARAKNRRVTITLVQ